MRSPTASQSRHCSTKPAAPANRSARSSRRLRRRLGGRRRRPPAYDSPASSCNRSGPASAPGSWSHSARAPAPWPRPPASRSGSPSRAPDSAGRASTGWHRSPMRWPRSVMATTRARSSASRAGVSSSPAAAPAHTPTAPPVSIASALRVFAPELIDHARFGRCDACEAPAVLTLSATPRGSLRWSPVRAMRIEVDPIACDAHGLCVELLPELITLDEWGYPLIEGGEIPPGLESLARRAASTCPTLALRLAARER